MAVGPKGGNFGSKSRDGQLLLAPPHLLAIAIGMMLLSNQWV